MNTTLNKNDIVDMVSSKLNKSRIVIGGNKTNYKRKYHLKYSKEIIKTVLDTYHEAMVEAIKNGDAVGIYDYFRLSPKYHRERIIKDNMRGGTLHMLPPRYTLSFRAFNKLAKACEDLLAKEPNGFED